MADEIESRIDLADERQLAVLRPYQFVTVDAEDALKMLAGISRQRPDLFSVVCDLSRSGTMFVCHLDQAMTEATGQNVLRYHPSDRLMVIMAAYVADGHLETAA